MEEFVEKNLKRRILPELIPKLLEETKKGTIKWNILDLCNNGFTDFPSCFTEYENLAIHITDSGRCIVICSKTDDFRVYFFVRFFFRKKIKPLKELYSLLLKQRTEGINYYFLPEPSFHYRSNDRNEKRTKSRRKKNRPKKRKMPSLKKQLIKKPEKPKEKEPKIGRL